VKNNRAEVEGLFDKRSSAEQAFLERYMAAAEAYERQLEDLRCADAEDYNLLKVRCGHTQHSGFRVQAKSLLHTQSCAQPTNSVCCVSACHPLLCVT
jgi:hypothetical protein